MLSRYSTLLFLSFLFFHSSVLLAELSVEPITPTLTKLPEGNEGEMIRYGFNLLNNTPEYIGPHGSVQHNAKNLLSCRHCHIDVGMREFGNSWLDSHSLYPQYREREGQIQTLGERVNACLVHNLLGHPLPLEGKEMKAMLLYFKWLSRGRVVPEKDKNDRLIALAYLDRPANPKLGEGIYKNKCSKCHGEDGQGQWRENKSTYIYPPLWGANSFMLGASMSRLSFLARFLKANMPYVVAAEKNTLSDIEAWDVAAYVLSHERPKWQGSPAFPILREKPFDFPIGPYADPFSLEQHRLGPFQPIIHFWIDKQGPRMQEPSTGV